MVDWKCVRTMNDCLNQILVVFILIVFCPLMHLIIFCFPVWNSSLVQSLEFTSHNDVVAIVFRLLVFFCILHAYMVIYCNYTIIWSIDLLIIDCFQIWMKILKMYFQKSSILNINLTNKDFTLYFLLHSIRYFLSFSCLCYFFSLSWVPKKSDQKIISIKLKDSVVAE